MGSMHQRQLLVDREYVNDGHSSDRKNVSNGFLAKDGDLSTLTSYYGPVYSFLISH